MSNAILLDSDGYRNGTLHIGRYGGKLHVGNVKGALHPTESKTQPEGYTVCNVSDPEMPDDGYYPWQVAVSDDTLAKYSTTTA